MYKSNPYHWVKETRIRPNVGINGGFAFMLLGVRWLILCDRSALVAHFKWTAEEDPAHEEQTEEPRHDRRRQEGTKGCFVDRLGPGEDLRELRYTSVRAGWA